MRYKIIIAGSRSFNNFDLMYSEVIKFLGDKPRVQYEIVSGGAEGADKLGELLAKKHNLKLTIMNADWNHYGKSAGYIRNVQMAKYADACIVFMKKGGSKGSQHMIDIADERGLDLKVIEF